MAAPKHDKAESVWTKAREIYDATRSLTSRRWLGFIVLELTFLAFLYGSFEAENDYNTRTFTAAMVVTFIAWVIAQTYEQSSAGKIAKKILED